MCAQADISISNSYRKFVGKEALLLELHDRLYRKVTKQMAACLASRPDAETLDAKLDILSSALVNAFTADTLARCHRDWLVPYVRFIEERCKPHMPAGQPLTLIFDAIADPQAIDGLPTTDWLLGKPKPTTLPSHNTHLQ